MYFFDESVDAWFISRQGKVEDNIVCLEMETWFYQNWFKKQKSTYFLAE